MKTLAYIVDDIFDKIRIYPFWWKSKGKNKDICQYNIVFAINGIWHGANWTFILWGLIHGALSVTDRIFEKTQKKLMEVVRWGYTFLVINVLDPAVEDHII